MLNFILKILAYGVTPLLAVMGAVVTLRPVAKRDHRRQRLWLMSFAVGGMVSFVSGLWLSQRQDAELEQRLTGGDSYVYLFADSQQLQERANPDQIWICSTGLMFDVRVHFVPFGVQYPAPEYFSLPGFSLGNVPGGCRWAPIKLGPGKYSIELDSRNGLAIETLEIVSHEANPSTQVCALERNETSLPTTNCH
jgi:hypothetical protein